MSDSCPSAVPCPCDNLADTPYDGSTPEARTFIATGFAAVVPPLGQTWNRLSCMMFSSSPVSQETADFTAQQQAQLCALGSVSPYSPETGPGGGGSGGGGGGGGVVFFNSPQECTVHCADGSPFTFQVPAGAFPGTTQAAADIAAQTFACAQANQRVICLGDLTPPFYTVNSPFTGTITATGGSLAGPGQVNVWEMVSGSLPPGLVFNGGLTQASSVTISGTPTMAGVFTFTVRCTDPLGDTMTKTYTLASAQVTAIWGPGYNGTMPGGQVSPVAILDCPLYAVGNYAEFTPAAPYTDGWRDLNETDSGHYNNHDLKFESAVALTWHWRLTGSGLRPGSGDPSHLFTNLYEFVNLPYCFGGVASNTLNPNVANDGTLDVTGTFTTDASTTIYLRYGFRPNTGPAGSLNFSFYATNP